MKYKILAPLFAICLALGAFTTSAEAGSGHRQKGHHGGHHKGHHAGPSVAFKFGYVVLGGHNRGHHYRGRHHGRHHYRAPRRHGHHYRHGRGHYRGYHRIGYYNDDPGYYYPQPQPRVSIQPQTAVSPRYCREYQIPVTIGGRVERAYGEACYNEDGAWKKN